MLTIYRRHRKNCKQRMAGRDYRRCLCPIWVDGSLNGAEMRKSLRLRDWQRAQDLVRQWEAEGQKIEKPKPLTVKEACDKFLVDAEARNLREPTLYKYRLLFRQLQEFASLYGYSYIPDFDVDSVRRFRASWPNRNIAARKKLEAFRAFFRFVHESGWIPTNPASHLKPPRITEPPTAPFTREEFKSILEACDIYPDPLNAIRLESHPGRQTLFVYGKNGHGGLLPAPAICHGGSQRHSSEHLFLLEWIVEAEERGGRLAAQPETTPDPGWCAGRACASIPRYLFRGAASRRRADRAGLDAPRSSKRAHHREALRPLGPGAPRAVGGRCSAHLGDS